jgi:hypothetical protein
MEYTALMKDPRLQPLWKRGFGNKVERIFQGILDIPGTDTCFFVELKNISKDRKITNAKISGDYMPHKREKERVRLMVGGDRLDYSGDVATSTVHITTFKILINSTPSTADVDVASFLRRCSRGLKHLEWMKAILRWYAEVMDGPARSITGLA